MCDYILARQMTFIDDRYRDIWGHMKLDIF